MTLGNCRNEHYWFSGAFCLRQAAFPSAMPSDLTGIIRTIKVPPQQANKAQTKKQIQDSHCISTETTDERMESMVTSNGLENDLFVTLFWAIRQKTLTGPFPVGTVALREDIL